MTTYIILLVLSLSVMQFVLGYITCHYLTRQRLRSIMTVVEPTLPYLGQRNKKGKP